MGKLSRFLHLERSRPNPGPAQPDAATSGRFAKLEPRREGPAPDPFAPPPERELHLEVQSAPDPTVARAKAERNARAEAELAEKHDLALERLREANKPLVRMTDGERRFALGAGIPVIVLCALIVSPVFWAVLPVLIGVVIASFSPRG